MVLLAVALFQCKKYQKNTIHLNLYKYTSSNSPLNIMRTSTCNHKDRNASSLLLLKSWILINYCLQLAETFLQIEKKEGT